MKTRVTQVTVHEAKTHLSRLIARVERGEEVVIARRNKPSVKLVPVEQAPAGRRFGAFKDTVAFDDSFFDPLPEEELLAWEGRLGVHEPE